MSVAVNKLREWRENPDIFVEEVFKVTPDSWQREVLKAFPNNQRIAMKSCRGPGKTCLLAWLCWNFLLTRPSPKIAATSISGDNLRDGLWTEMAKWREKSNLLKEMFTWQKERIFAKEAPETWWMAARQWSKTADKESLGTTLAGFRAEYVMFVLDESGGIPEEIMASAEATLASCKEGHIVQAGNPTHTEGPLYRACTADKKFWFIVEITGDPNDPNRSPRVSRQWAQEQIEKYGPDNPWVLVNVFGRFPPQGFNSLIGIDDLEISLKRRYRQPDFERSPFIIGVDSARYGSDSNILFPRQGLQCFPPEQYRNIDGSYGAEVVIRMMNKYKADAVFVDDTGGFGSSWIDNLLRLGKSPIPVAFSAKSSNPQYYNKRTEMAFECVNWIRRGGAIPNIKELKDALLQTTYTFKGDQLLLEPKEDVKDKLGYSPDHMDGLMLTFAMPVDKQHDPLSYNRGNNLFDYNPLDQAYIRATR